MTFEYPPWNKECARASMGLHAGPLFTKRTDILPHDLVKSQGREIRVQTFQIALKFDWNFGSSAAEMLVKFQSDTIFMTPNLAASGLHEIWW